jgi:hypothetical protein
MDLRSHLFSRTPAAHHKKRGAAVRLLRNECCACLFGLLFVLWLPCFAVGQAATDINPNKVEAAFLRNFARYVTWPEGVFPNENAPWKICILGDDPFGDVLEKTLAGRTEQGRTFEVYRADSVEHMPPCQIVFVAIQDAEKRREALQSLRSQPVLTVGDAPGFLREGGIIRFLISDRVEMCVNLDQARQVSLNIQTKMLEVSREVLENGAVRRLK